MDVRARSLDAARRIRPFVRRTPLEPSPWLTDGGGAVSLKLENTQRTGSFKLRGALAKLTSLPEPELARGVVAASTGNHGMAVALGARELGTHAVVFAPESAVRSKLATIEAFGAEIRLAGSDCIEAERAAREHAASSATTYVSPYNDTEVVAGQGTIALELEEDVPDLDAVIVAVGGGGLVSGIGGVLASSQRDVEIVAASPRNSCVLRDSLEAGRVLDLPSDPTLSDATAGGLEEDSVTFELAGRVIDRFVVVDEDEIADSLRGVIENHHTLVEGAAGVAVAAYRRERESYAGRNVAIVLCGANIATETLAAILTR